MTATPYLPPDVAARIADRKARGERSYVPIMEMRRPVREAGETNCAACDHLGVLHDEARRGFCLLRKRMVSTWHPAICSAYSPLVREKTLKVKWQGVSYE